MVTEDWQVYSLIPSRPWSIIYHFSWANFGIHQKLANVL
jgi:hypothetical protein